MRIVSRDRNHFYGTHKGYNVEIDKEPDGGAHPHVRGGTMNKLRDEIAMAICLVGCGIAARCRRNQALTLPVYKALANQGDTHV